MKLLVRVPDKWRHRVDNWRWWMSVAFFGLVFAGVMLYVVNKRTTEALARQTRADAVRISESRSASEAAYNRCVESIPTITRFSTHVAGVNDLAQTLLRNSEETLRLTPRGDPLYSQRVENLARLRAAAKRIAAIRDIPAPSLKECDQRRREALRGVG